jgi:hypothetical protein
LTVAFDLTALALVAAGNLLLAARLNSAPLAFLLIAAGIVVRIAQVRTALAAIPLHLPWILFVASGLIV